VRSSLPVESSTEARAGFGIVNGLTFLREHRLNAGSVENVPAYGGA
jgi:hypothetical protein